MQASKGKTDSAQQKPSHGMFGEQKCGWSENYLSNGVWGGYPRSKEQHENDDGNGRCLKPCSGDKAK